MLPPPHPHPTGGGGGLGTKISKQLSIKYSKESRECSYSGRSRVIRGREGRRQGRIGERGEREDERGRGRGSRAKPGNQLVTYNKEKELLYLCIK